MIGARAVTHLVTAGHRHLAVVVPRDHCLTQLGLARMRGAEQVGITYGCRIYQSIWLTTSMRPRASSPSRESWSANLRGDTAGWNDDRQARKPAGRFDVDVVAGYGE